MPGISPELVEADLKGLNLGGADLHSANLRKANFEGANLIGANFVNARLAGAFLAGARVNTADFAGANLARAELAGANLSEAYLGGVDFTQANLHNATMHGAIMSRTKLLDVDLSNVLGLDTVRHKAPSSISVGTVYQSKGRIPHKFLRGAGVPENFIEYMSSLTGAGFEFYSCFISYSSKDQEFADRLFADLQNEGVRCWFAPHHVQGGKKLHEQIDAAIRLHERLLLILSPESISSEWVKTEIAKARRREVRENRRVLFPIRLNISYQELQGWECFDADRGKDSAREIREYYIPDFTQWKNHDRYQEEFKKLLRDLKKESSTPAAP